MSKTVKMKGLTVRNLVAPLATRMGTRQCASQAAWPRT